MSFLWFEQTLDLQAKNATDFSAAFFVCKFSDFQSAVLLRLLRVAGADEPARPRLNEGFTLPAAMGAPLFNGNCARMNYSRPRLKALRLCRKKLLRAKAASLALKQKTVAEDFRTVVYFTVSAKNYPRTHNLSAFYQNKQRTEFFRPQLFYESL